jgi:hypothetical protein
MEPYRKRVGYEDSLVHEWRVAQLKRLGIPWVLAEAAADNVDWHAIDGLVQRGCPPELALRIVHLPPAGGGVRDAPSGCRGSIGRRPSFLREREARGYALLACSVWWSAVVSGAGGRPSAGTAVANGASSVS